MKKYIYILIMMMLIGSVACNQSSKNKKQTEQEAVVYSCPMHPEVTSNKAGDCPKCGMALVKKDENNHTDSTSNAAEEIE